MAKSIMIQGTMSNAGKSLLVTALCRVFKQDGYKVAPFKSQNMALNSFITWDGLEMGRAQVAQAEACGIEPDVRMNPILLKPTTDIGSQVIVNGKVKGQYAARDYFAIKKSFIPDILEAYNGLAEENDIIVLEGAGSPAEINLKSDDIVNMGMAKLVDAPVLLAGNIDPGGVFAQLYGTVKLLEPDEQERIKGLIINMFRGDKTILDPGIEMLEEKVGIPVVGTIPYMKVDIDDEDSMSGRLRNAKYSGDRPIDVAIIRLPKISNFTDFAPLEAHSYLGVRYVGSLEELGTPDLIIIPGTKSTMADLEWMNENGLADAIRKRAAAGTFILGVCGGYQMLGTMLSDPHGVEGGGDMAGLSLLPEQTVFAPLKTRTQTKAVLKTGYLSGTEVEGYEIHMGVNEPTGEFEYPANVVGTYIHGLFDNGTSVERLAEVLAAKKGLEAPTERIENRKEYKERQYDILADVLREYLDMDKVYEIMGIDRGSNE